MATPTIRAARLADADAIAAIAATTWPDREIEDYLPDVFESWVRSDGERQRTAVAVFDGEVAGICQVTMLSGYEAWLQGMRVARDHRGQGVALALVDDLFGWARERGATVARNLVYSWNPAGLGQSLAAGFEPCTSFRWLRPAPREDALDAVEGTATVASDPAAAWSCWLRSDARDALSGLVLDPDQRWAVSELTRERLRDRASAVLAVKGDGTRAMTWRNGVAERDGRRVADYGAAAWADADAARTLLAAVRADAAAQDADATRVLVPETPRHVAEAAFVRGAPEDEPHFVTEADLTGVA
ncbi:MAG: GNAT family N-acetyltransferase [Haloarculaceae archaeon]